MEGWIATQHPLQLSGQNFHCVVDQPIISSPPCKWNKKERKKKKQASFGKALYLDHNRIDGGSQLKAAFLEHENAGVVDTSPYREVCMHVGEGGRRIIITNPTSNLNTACI